MLRIMIVRYPGKQNFTSFYCVSSKMQQMISQRVLLTWTKILYTCMMVIIMIMEHREPRPHAGFTENVEFEWRYKRIWKGIKLKFLCSLTTFCFPFFVWIGPCLNYFSRMRIVFGLPSHTSYARKSKSLKLQLYYIWLFWKFIICYQKPWATGLRWKCYGATFYLFQNMLLQS